jgi:hypothetical protein
MKKTFLIGAALAVALSAGAQFRMDKDYQTAGIKVVKTDSETQLTVDFNSTTETPAGSGNWVISPLQVPGGGVKKLQNQKGVQIKVYNELGGEAAVADGKVNNYGSNGNWIHISNPDSVVKYYTAAESYSANNKFWQPNVCLFDIDENDLGNQAVGAYPGMYKKVDYRFYFNFEGNSVSSDITFDIMTLSDGNTGKPAKYRLMVSLGSDKTYTSIDASPKTPDYEVADFYTTGAANGVTTVKLAEALGVNPSVFTNKKVYISLYTDGTGQAINPYQYDPVIAFDNFKVTFNSAIWINPAVAAEAVVDNQDAPVDDISTNDTEALFPLDLEMASRFGTFTAIIDNGVHPSALAYRIAGLQKWDGANWIDLPATITEPVENTADGSWSKEKIVTNSNGDGAQEKIRILFRRTLKAGDAAGTVVKELLELTNGARIRYTFYGKIKSSTVLVAPTSEASEVYASSRKLYVTNVSDDINIYNLSGQLVKTASGIDGQKGISLAEGNYLVSTKEGTVKVNIQK